MIRPDIQGVSLIGVPTDVGAGTRGARMGPEALRVAGLAQAIEAFGHEVRDCGNLSGPANPWQPAVNGYRHLAEVAEWNRTLHTAMLAELQQNRLPIMMGGDHCLGMGSISAVARHCKATGRKLRVLWLDAHADFNTATLTPSGNIHGMPVACLCGHGPAELVDMGGPGHRLHPRDIRQVGIRSVDPGEKRLQTAIAKVSAEYDFVLIDCPPSLSMLTLNGLCAANGVIVPMQCEYFALEGLTDLVNTIKQVHANLNKDLQIIGLLRVMFDPRITLQQQVSEQLKAHFADKVFNTVIPRNVRLAEAPSYGLPGVVFDPNAKGSQAYIEFAQEMVDRIKA